MPGLVKIGHTSGSLYSRLQQLASTGVPNHFQLIASFYVSDSQQCEKDVHHKLQRYRSNPKREFFLGTPAQLINESFSVILSYIASGENAAVSIKSQEKYAPDEDDIYFMLFLFHDCYQQGTSYSSTELAKHHRNYSPIELDVKLMQLASHGYIKRINREHDGIGRWAILPKGVKFMLDGNHHDQSLLDETNE